MSETTRREFLAQSGAAVVGIAVTASTAAGAETPAQPVRTGSGEHTYECVHDWLTPPANIHWGDTHGVAQDAQGHIYIAHTVHANSPSGDAIVVFDKDGKFLTSWGSRFRGGAHGLDLRREADGNEYLYHCDTKNKLVVKTTLDGTVIWEKGVPTEAGVYADGKPFTPTNIAFAPDGGFYVGDGYGSSYIHRYNAKGEWVQTFGGKGSEPGQVSCPHGLIVDDRGGREPLLVVADRGNRRLQYFTLDGKHVRFDKDGMRQPCHFHTRGDLLLVPDLDSVVTLLDKDNKLVAHLGDGADATGKPSQLRGAPREAFIPGKFNTPHGAKFLQNGDILVVEWVPIGRITLLRKVAA